ncbi:MAG: thioredoxin family protein [Bacteroidetes bacterium]|jgi:small redox-active disulfide protein 2|nr:thioredoxin family protein [Bacteroidota bacterium]
MTIKILGSGCMNCRTLEQRTKEALGQLGISADVEKVEDYQRIASYGIMRTPGLVIDEKVVSAGVVLPVEKIKEILLARRSGA